VAQATGWQNAIDHSVGSGPGGDGGWFFGLGAASDERSIDTTRPFDVEASFDEWGHMTIRLVQNGTTPLTLWDGAIASPAGRGWNREAVAWQTKQAMQTGMVFVTSLWGTEDWDSSGMSWLDGGCGRAYRHCHLPDTRLVLSDLLITPRDRP
jgi:hypothetical protein